MFLNQSFSKIWIIVIAVVLITSGILAWQYYFGVSKEENKTPEEGIKEATKDETADWKTYRNEEYGFEIKCLREWEVGGTNCIFFEGNTLRICINAEPTLDACLIPACSFDTTTKIGGIEATKRFNAIWGWVQYDPPKVIIYDGEVCYENCCEIAEKMSKDECEKLLFITEINSFFSFQDKLFAISFICPENWHGVEGREKCSRFYDQMISTFRFLE